MPLQIETAISLSFFSTCWWHCADVIVGNDRLRGVFILKALMTTALKSLLFASCWNTNNFYSLQSLRCLCLVYKRKTSLIFKCLFNQIKVTHISVTGTTSHYIWIYPLLPIDRHAFHICTLHRPAYVKCTTVLPLALFHCSAQSL